MLCTYVKIKEKTVWQLAFMMINKIKKTRALPDSLKGRLAAVPIQLQTLQYTAVIWYHVKALVRIFIAHLFAHIIFPPSVVSLIMSLK